MITSRKNTGRPPPNRKIKYGMRKAPAERAEGEEGRAGPVTRAEAVGACSQALPPTERRECVRDVRGEGQIPGCG